MPVPGSKRPTPPVPSQSREQLEAAHALANNAVIAINKPEYVTYFVVIEAMKMFQRLTGREPCVMYIPRILEAALEINWVRSMGGEHGTKLRSLEKLCGCRAVYDSDEFRIE